MKPHSTFSINSARFAHETVDDEAIVIDMTEGSYFSLRGSAAIIWSLVASGLPLHEVVSQISQATGETSDRILPEVESFISQLIQEEILSASSASADVETTSNLPPFEYTTAVIDKYTDMQDLLTLDPIHEVDETGWPNRASGVSD